MRLHFEQVLNAGREIGLQNQCNMGSIPILLSTLWKVSITGNAAVLKTAVRITAFAGSSPAPSAITRRIRQPVEKSGRKNNYGE